MNLYDETKGNVEIHNVIIDKVADNIKDDLKAVLKENNKKYKEGDNIKFTNFIINTFNMALSDSLEKGISINLPNFGSIRCKKIRE